MTIPTSVPQRVIAGDTWRWSREYADYAAPTWTVTFYFENKDDTFSAAASGSTTTHSFSLAAATTTARKPGRYLWTARATDGTIVETIESGWIEVAVNPAAAGNSDTRSWARKTLDALEATLQGRATSDQLAMAVNGRSISRIPLPELRQWRDQLRQEVRVEEQGSRAGLGRNIKVRLGRG